ncbi:hypothetical protein GGQ64_004962 [Rhizobium azooxidifex]|uniref:Uncharacterized protein n=1 Tax=Mycoplana azooxidifex TaxID=1636188 RepID=A0A7W6DBP5_9HYPH|nr:hypothetical protein [Mycoplana azooxidifex]MBB3979717.1 hypothetical protein [Mycoplana azooxidifex]
MSFSGHCNYGSSLSSVLNDYAVLMSRAERLLLAKLKAGRVWTGDLKVSFYQHLGISATHLDMAYRQFQAKLKSVSELAKDRSHDSTGRIDSKRADIRQKQMALTKAKATGSKLLVERMTATSICSCACHVRWRTRQGAPSGSPVSLSIVSTSSVSLSIMATTSLSQRWGQVSDYPEVRPRRVSWRSPSTTGSIGWRPTSVAARSASTSTLDISRRHCSTLPAIRSKSSIFPAYGKTSDQAKDTVRKVAAAIASLAARHGVPVVSEHLKFAKKKLALASSGDARYARLLSGFAYSAFGGALAFACHRSAVAHGRVNPAYKSISVA